MEWNDELIKNLASCPRMIACLVYLAAGGRGTGNPAHCAIDNIH